MTRLQLFLETLGIHPAFQTPWKPGHSEEVPF